MQHVLAAAAASATRTGTREFADRLARRLPAAAGPQGQEALPRHASALGVIIGLASRAPLTLFDEPYLGLDAVARQIFYDRLLADYAEHPRTVMLSTHLIDEVANLLEHVLVHRPGPDHHGRRRRRAARHAPSSLPARPPPWTHSARGPPCCTASTLGEQARATVRRTASGAEVARLREEGVELEPASLQELVIRSTTATKEPTR